MLSDEENNVIDLLKNIDKQKCLMLNCPVVKNNIERQLKIIELNRIIRKQSKEIELLKEENEKYKNPPFFDEDNYISKEKSEQKEKEAYIDGTNIADELCNKYWQDKIKAKIEIRKEEKENCKDSIEEKYLLREIYVLQSLLEKE